MEINVHLDDGLLPDKYGKFAPVNDIKNGKPVISFPIQLSNIPASTKSLAFTFTDPDSIPVCGFEWIHWTAANLAPDQLELPEDFSRTAPSTFVQGKNSSASPLVGDNDDDLKVGYNGPNPPDKTHDYVLKVYALSDILDIKEGFWMNELLHKMEGKVLDSAQITLPSRAN